MQAVDYWGFFLKNTSSHTPKNQEEKLEAFSSNNPSNLNDDGKTKGTNPGGKSAQKEQQSAPDLFSSSSIKHFYSPGWGQVNLHLNFPSPSEVALSTLRFFESGDAELPKETKIK